MIKIEGAKRLSSTPITRPPRQSLARIKKDTVSGMVNRFSQMIESSGDVTDRKPAGRQMSLFTEFSTINETSNGSDSKFNSGDSGYGDDSFRRRSRSVNTITAITNASKVVLSKYEKHPNFKFSYLKYFGVEPTEYLSTFGIEYDSVSDTVFNLSDRKANGSDTVTNDIEFSIKRKRSHTVSSKKTFDSTVVKVSKLNYFAAETVDVTLGENVPMKVATSIECTDLEDVFTTKVVASREVFLEKSLRSVATQTCEPELETVDSDDGEFFVLRISFS